VASAVSAPFVVHAGAHKTGTTAVQAWLQRERKALLERQVLVPTFGVGGQGNHANLIRALLDAPDTSPAEATNLREALRREAEAHPRHTIVVSSEYVETPQCRPRLHRLVEQIRALDREPVAVFGCREQGALLNSRHAQRRKAFLRVVPFDAFARRAVARRSGDWQAWAAQLEAAGFRVLPFAYTDEVRRQGVATSMARLPPLAAAAPLATRAGRDEVNPSLGSVGLILADLVRSRVEASRGMVGDGSRGPLQKLVMRQAAAWTDVPFNGLDGAAASELRAHFADSNRAFAERYLGQPWDELFPEPHEWPAVSPQRLEDLDPALREAVLRAADEVLRRADARAIWSRAVSGPGRGRSSRRFPSSREEPPG
jgi:hypothetical protein